MPLDGPSPAPNSAGDAPRVVPVAFSEALGERYLAYALSTITSRSLPDVRDGLKPVHRRLLWAMRQLNLSSAGAPKKSARVVGDVLGRYHPHGDASVYDAMVRLAQDFSVRYPLVDGQGNFGNIDGDNAAAMRYTEARLTPVAEALMDGLDEDAADFVATYDGEGREPAVMPSAIPNLLANGAQGIAVGMATSIPPHNLFELARALQLLVAKPDSPTEHLVHFVRGPDFPTGGVLVESRGAVLDAYRTGRGSFRVRARWTKEEIGGGRAKRVGSASEDRSAGSPASSGEWQIVVTEIPFQVQKSRLVERIAQLIVERRLPLLADVRDESAEDVRLVLEPKARSVDPEVLMEQLFRETDLETRFSLNLNVLDAAGVPRVMGLKEALVAYRDHRLEVLVRRKRNRLAAIDRRIEILDGYLVAYLNLDEVIRTIREAEDPKAALIARWSLSENQADAILAMRLRALNRLQEIEIERESQALRGERQGIEALLAPDEAGEALRKKALFNQFRAMGETYGPETVLGRRRTEIGEPPAAVDIPAEAAVEREPVTVLVSRQLWARAVKGHGLDPKEAKYREEDAEGWILECQSTDRLLVMADSGKIYTLAVERLTVDRQMKGRGFGEPLRMMVDLGDAGVIAVHVHDPESQLLIASSEGRGFRVAEKDVAAQTRAGKQVFKAPAGVKPVACLKIAEGLDHVAVAGGGAKPKLLCFPLDQVPEATSGKGAILQRYKDGGLSGIALFRLEEGLSWKDAGGKARNLKGDELPLAGRATQGQNLPKGFPADLGLAP